MFTCQSVLAPGPSHTSVEGGESETRVQGLRSFLVPVFFFLAKGHTSLITTARTAEGASAG